MASNLGAMASNLIENLTIMPAYASYVVQGVVHVFATAVDAVHSLDLRGSPFRTCWPDTRSGRVEPWPEGSSIADNPCFIWFSQFQS